MKSSIEADLPNGLNIIEYIDSISFADFEDVKNEYMDLIFSNNIMTNYVHSAVNKSLVNIKDIKRGREMLIPKNFSEDIFNQEYAAVLQSLSKKIIAVEGDIWAQWSEIGRDGYTKKLVPVVCFPLEKYTVFDIDEMITESLATAKADLSIYTERGYHLIYKLDYNEAFDKLPDYFRNKIDYKHKRCAKNVHGYWQSFLFNKTNGETRSMSWSNYDLLNRVQRLQEYVYRNTNIHERIVSIDD